MGRQKGKVIIMGLADYLGTALSVSVMMAVIPFILGYREKGNLKKQKRYWKISCIFGGISVVLGIAALAVMLPDML